MWARVVSVMFHPLFMPTYFFSLLAWALPTSLEPIKQGTQPKFLLFLFIVTALLPLLNVGIFKAFGTIRNFAMLERKERLMPFAFISVIYVAVTVLFYRQLGMNLNDNFLKLMLIIDLLVIAATVATFFFRVSVHCISVWGLIGIIIPLNKITEVKTLFYPALAVIILAGVIMSARLEVGAHTSREVMWGSVLGLVAAVTGMLILF
jgi:nitrate reductase NapE component